jgi:hypothetical protein
LFLTFPSKTIFHINNDKLFNMYNLNYIRYLFGNHTLLALKKRINTNYKIVKTTIQLEFLKHCKTNNVHPTHLSSICQKKFNFNHHRNTYKLDKLLYNVRKGILNIEIYDLHKRISFLTKEQNFLTFSLENNLPPYIWKEINGYHTTFFNNISMTNFKIWQLTPKNNN